MTLVIGLDTDNGTAYTETDDAPVVPIQTTLPAAKLSEPETILKRTVCLVLRNSYLGNSRRVDLKQYDLKETNGEDVGADKRELGASKRLLDRKELTQCEHVIASAKAYLRSVATQGHRVFGPGTSLVPVALVLDAETRLTQFKADLAVAVEALVARYPAAVEARKAALGHLFHAKDYLTPDEVRGEYSLDWNYISFSAPEQLEEVDRAVFEAAQAKHTAQLATAFDEVVVQLRASALTVMSELSERLKPGVDGKPKALRGTALQDLEAFAALLPRRNIGGDDALVEVVKRVAAYADGLNPDVLRSAPAVRAQLQALAAEAAGELEALVQTSSKRSISFGPLKP